MSHNKGMRKNQSMLVKPDLIKKYLGNHKDLTKRLIKQLVSTKSLGLDKKQLDELKSNLRKMDLNLFDIENHIHIGLLLGYFSGRERREHAENIVRSLDIKNATLEDKKAKFKELKDLDLFFVCLNPKKHNNKRKDWDSIGESDQEITWVLCQISSLFGIMKDYGFQFKEIKDFKLDQIQVKFLHVNFQELEKEHKETLKRIIEANIKNINELLTREYSSQIKKEAIEKHRTVEEKLKEYGVDFEAFSAINSFKGDSENKNHAFEEEGSDTESVKPQSNQEYPGERTESRKFFIIPNGRMPPGFSNYGYARHENGWRQPTVETQYEEMVEEQENFQSAGQKPSNALHNSGRGQAQSLTEKKENKMDEERPCNPTDPSYDFKSKHESTDKGEGIEFWKSEQTNEQLLLNLETNIFDVINLLPEMLEDDDFINNDQQLN